MISWLNLAMALATLVASCTALIVSFRALLVARRRIAQVASQSDLKKLQLEQLELLDNQEKLLTQVKKLYGREAVRKHRNKPKPEETPDEETDEQWKARMNARYAITGKIDG